MLWLVENGSEMFLLPIMVLAIVDEEPRNLALTFLTRLSANVFLMGHTVAKLLFFVAISASIVSPNLNFLLLWPLLCCSSIHYLHYVCSQSCYKSP